MRAAFALVLGIALTLPSAALSKSCAHLRFEPRTSISITEFADLATEPVTVDVRGGNFMYWRFDPENSPAQHGWDGIALVIAGTGDLGEHPVAGIVWTDVEAEDIAAFRAVHTGNSVVFQPPEKAACPGASVTLDWRAKDRIYANGVFVGRVRRP